MKIRAIKIILSLFVLFLFIVPGISFAIDLEYMPNKQFKGVKPYKVKSDLSNVTNTELFKLKRDAKKMLSENAFVVIPKHYNEFFSIYECHRYENIPNFITTDSILHNYHLFFDHILKTVEKKHLIARLKKMTVLLLETSEKYHSETKGTKWENSAKRNIAFFAVALKLLDSKYKCPSGVNKVVNEELKNISSHSSILPSPILDNKVDQDYTQYIPRGHYTRTEELKRYFKAMMWYGQVMYLLNYSELTKSAVLMTMALNENKEAFKLWNNIYEVTKFFVGESDDLTYKDYYPLLENVYGDKVNVKTLIKEDSKLDIFIEKARELRPSMIISVPSIEKIEEKAGKPSGFKFMGQRYVIDAGLLQQLVYTRIGTAGNPRMLPKGLDVPAVFGSDEALNILTEIGETKYRKYLTNVDLLKRYIKGLKESEWTANLYSMWLKTLHVLVLSKGKEYPTFMQNKAWKRKELNTFLGSWTELKHDSILYAGEITAEGGYEEPEKTHGYVEPYPHFYHVMKILVEMTLNGIKKYDLLEENIEKRLEEFKGIVNKLKIISEKELNNVDLTDAEYEFIKDYGLKLEDFWLEIFKDEPGDISGKLMNNPAAIVADVATDPIGQKVLEEAIGNVYEILVVVPVKGKLVLSSGAVFSYFEFVKPISERMTDEEWRKILIWGEGEMPDPPYWTKSFTTKKKD